MKKSTKRALLSSVLALVLCVSMLVGTTFAWFTDSVTSANNIIKSGNLDIVLEYLKNGEWEDVNGQSDIITNTLWEPGVTEVAYLRIANAGSLALKYQLGINIASEIDGVNVAGESFTLSDYILFGVIELDAFSTFDNREAAIAAATGAKKISAGYTKADTLEAADPEEELEYVYLAMVVYMPDTVGNEANHNGVNIPEINLGINVFATQAASEKDSFGSDYDKDAAFVSAPVVRPENATSGMNLKGVNDVVISLPAAVINALPEGVEEIGMAVSDPVIDANTNTVTFAAVELVDQNGDKIDLDALDLTEDITVTLPLPESAPFADGEEVMIYHDGVLVATTTVANGNISYDVAHLCEITVGTIEEPVVNGNTVAIANVSQLIGFAQSVNAGNSYAGKTVVLTDNINLNNVAWTPIGNWDYAFEGTFDGNDKVIKNLYINDAEGEGVGFFGVVANATIKNVTIENVNVNGYSMVAGLVGAAYPATIENCHVTGDINIVADWAYVAGIAGYCYYGTQVTGCSTIATETGLIKSETRNAVGGITAWLLEGNHNVTNCSVKNLDLVGWTNVGGITGFVHYNNTISGCSVENVNLVKTRVDGNPGIGLIAGGWSYSASNAITLKDNTIENATLTGNHKVYAAYNELYGSEYGGAITTNFVLENNTTKDIVNNLTTYTVVKTGDELKAALANNEDVIFANDITMAATESNGYGVTGINIKNGQTIDGNGYTLKVTGAGATWASAISTTGGLIKNLTVAQGFRGIFVNHNSTHSETVVLDNVTIQGPTYTISCDQGTNQNLIATNCTINGWTSYATTIGTVKFENCEFGYGAGYKFARPYAATEFVGCSFVAGYAVDARATSTFENCTFAGAALTADNLATLVTSNTANATIK